MAGILGVKPVSKRTCLNQKKRFSSPAYTLKNHELVVAMLIKTGSKDTVLHLLFTNVNITIELMFAGINMFLARLRLILARAQRGLK